LSSGGGRSQIVTTNAPIHITGGKIATWYVVTKEQITKRAWRGIGENKQAAMAKPKMSPKKCTSKISQRSSDIVEDLKPACQAEG
jgi:hypothetical protein